MDKNELIDQTLKQNDLTVSNYHDCEEYSKFIINNCCFLFLEKKSNIIYLSFNASIRPDFSSWLTSLIYNIGITDKIIPIELYYNDPKGTIFGDNAYKNFINDVEQSAVSKYWKQIQEFSLLKEFEPELVQ